MGTKYEEKIKRSDGDNKKKAVMEEKRISRRNFTSSCHSKVYSEIPRYPTPCFTNLTFTLLHSTSSPNKSKAIV